MDIQHLRSLLVETKALLDLYESTQTDTLRVDAQDKAAQLARALAVSYTHLRAHETDS